VNVKNQSATDERMALADELIVTLTVVGIVSVAMLGLGIIGCKSDVFAKIDLSLTGVSLSIKVRSS
jgi:hypothetical protein